MSEERKVEDKSKKDERWYENGWTGRLQDAPQTRHGIYNIFLIITAK